MYITARVDYATRALLALATAPGGELVKANAIAAQNRLPSQKFTENILGDLRAAGLVIGKRGSHGGFRLARPPHEISLADVFNALSVPVVEVHGRRPRRITRAKRVDNLPAVWAGVQGTLELVLESVTLAQIVSGELPAALNDQARRH